MVVRTELPKDISMWDVLSAVALFPEGDYISRVRIKEKLGVYDDSTLRYKEMSTEVDNCLDDAVKLNILESKVVSVSPEYSSRCYRFASL